MTKFFYYKLLLTVIIMFSAMTQLKSQEEKLKAIFVYNFTKYINWPHKSGNFVITIVGKSVIAAEIASIASKRTVGSSLIEVKIVNSPEEITESNIIYVPAPKTGVLSTIKQKSIDDHCLIITEKPDACKNGSGINFVNNDGKLGFEISKDNIESCGLAISTDLLKLGTIVK